MGSALFMEGIKNIVFDLGNVILDLDMERFEKTMKDLWGDQYEAAWQEGHERKIFQRFETGEISEETFMWHWQNLYKDLVGKSYDLLTPHAIITAWNSMLDPIKPKRLEMLERLAKKYRIFLYSNTNSIHLEWVNRHLKREYKITIEDFNKKYFEKAYYSHIIQYRKPHVDGFLHILDDADLVAEETLFIDDTLENIEGAQLAGMKGLHHPFGNEIIKVMAKF